MKYHEAMQIDGTVRVFEYGRHARKPKLVTVITRDELQQLHDLAREMLGSSSHMVLDEETGNYDYDPDVIDLLKRFRKAFQLKKPSWDKR